MKADRLERFVVDTNVLISATLGAHGSPARLLDKLFEIHACLVFSNPTRDELHARLLLRKFDRYVTVAARQTLLAQLDAVGELVAIAGGPMGCRDPGDDMFLETALAGEADALVSGDDDLLTLHPYRGLPVLRPADCLQALSTAQ